MDQDIYALNIKRDNSCDITEIFNIPYKKMISKKTTNSEEFQKHHERNMRWRPQIGHTQQEVVTIKWWSQCEVASTLLTRPQREVTSMFYFFFKDRLLFLIFYNIYYMYVDLLLKHMFFLF